MEIIISDPESEIVVCGPLASLALFILLLPLVHTEPDSSKQDTDSIINDIDPLLLQL
jgi:hypothetical protein